MIRTWFSDTVSRKLIRNSCKRSAKVPLQPGRSLRLESLEVRAVPAVLLVPADFVEIQDAVDAANPGDTIKVASGTYQPFTVTTDGLTIREATANSNPVIDATGEEVGIELNADRVTLRGLIVENAEQHGFLVTGDSNTLRDNTARNVVPVEQGFPSGSGFSLFDADDNRLIRNRSENNGGTGFLLRNDSDGNILRGNTAEGNPTGYNVGGLDEFGESDSLDSTNDHNELLFNKATGYLFAGFNINGASEFERVSECGCLKETLTPATGTSLIGNSAVSEDGFLAGFVVNNTDGTTLKFNYTSDNSADGFQINIGNSVTLNGNLSLDNGRGGFFLSSLTSSTIIRNTAIGNGGNGFALTSSDRGDRVSSSDNTLKWNLAASNGGDGFVVRSLAFPAPPGGGPVSGVLTKNNALEKNIASENGGVGFHLVGTSGNTQEDNKARRNTGDGFRVAELPVFDFFTGDLAGSFASDNNQVIDNVAEDNSGYGFFVDVVLTNFFDDNEAEDNALGGSNLAGILDN